MSANCVTIQKEITTTAEVEVDIDEIIDEMDEEQLVNALAQKRMGWTAHKQLENVYYEFARRGDAPKCLRDYLYEMTGRTLP
jgi:hypothetical protein